MNANKEYFKDIVGQDQIKQELSFYLHAYEQTRIMPHMLLVAAKGQGKTTLARALAKNLLQFDEDGKPMLVPSKLNPNVTVPKKKPFVEINCSTLKSVKQFINAIVVPFVQDKDVTLLFDEASEIPRDVTMALLTILNPNPDNRTTFALDEYVCDFDFRRQTFLFATSESQKMFHALADRLERITLQDYTTANLAEIVSKGLPKDVTCKGNVLLDVATVLRGNARAGQKMASKIVAYLAGKKEFTPKGWSDLRNILTIRPLGLNALEVQILRYLAENATGTSLTGLSAKTGMSRESLQKDAELFLQKHNLMEITTEGRVITGKGLDYLKQLDTCAAA